MLVWGDFFADLRTSSKEMPPPSYTHTSSGAVYGRGEVLGEGQYGRVTVYMLLAPVPDVPRAFCVKTVTGDFSEACAIAALDTLAQNLGSGAVEGIVAAHVVRVVGETYEVAMPRYDGSLADIEERSDELAYWTLVSVLRTIMTLWSAGLAYCDLKTSNILFKAEGHRGTVVIGDLGSIVPVGQHGIFTFPPRRAFYEGYEQKRDGIVECCEQDLVWVLGVLVVALAVGQHEVNRASVSCIREHPKGLEAAFREIVERFETIKESLLGGSFHASRCGSALRVALAAWEGDEEATLARMKLALGVRPPQKAAQSNLLTAPFGREISAPPVSVRTA